jgi:hypothetical protein
VVVDEKAQAFVKGTGKLHLNGLEVVWFDRFRLRDGPPVILFFYFPFIFK